eukprot:CAMPEP_0118653280 /NCGR_PEP_ID=MMETSP0785-20121206/11751_1 /TAXON_ID=91992 /ORGANISM="Bolidomonas pacifica, Strain CCMP 1866" /LENGTH=271 /DNA_ID=CAMNT_0006545821 /DNA_START=35 /DNA_END=847 /DNA_ORIENTATION=+
MTERFAGPSIRRVAPPGGTTQTIQKAPPREILDSKRIPVMSNVESSLHATELVLDEGTRRRNREFKRRMDAVEERQVEWMGRLKEEEKGRDEEHRVVLGGIEKMLDETVKGIWDKIEEDFSVFHKVHIPPLEDRMTKQEEDFEYFVYTTVPRLIDECTEIIARRVEKARETFIIENTKVMKREEKVVERFERHVGRTMQGMEDEEATRISKLRLLTEEIDVPERVDEREEEVRITKIMKDIIVVREMIAKIVSERKVEDGVVLDQMLKTQE